MPRKRKQTFGFQGGVSVKTPMGLAVQANAKANYALSQLNTEKKVKDGAISVSPPITGSIQLLNGLAQGITNTTRIGDSVRFTNLALRIRMDGHATTDSIVRLMLVRDKAPNGGLPSMASLLNTVDVKSFRNLDWIKRYDILWDNNYVVLAQTSASSNVKFIEKYIDLAERRKELKPNSTKAVNETEYGLNNLGTIADIATNAYYLVVLSDHATDFVDFDCFYRMRYLDN